jgi:uncharacterized protein YkwD
MRRRFERLVLTLFAPLLLLALLGCREGTDLPAAPPVAPAGPSDPQVAAFVSLVNEHRRAIGAPILTWDDRAAAVALAHSQDMEARGYFSHTTPEGLSPFDRMRAAGITFTAAAENIAWGYASAGAVYQGWMSSPGHRANLENAVYTHHGVGRSGTYWTHVFFTPPSP